MRRAAGVLFFAASVAVAVSCAPAAGVTQGTAAPSDSAAPRRRPDDGGPVDAFALPGLLDTSDEQIPNDDDVRTGTLDNGLRYYVRENDRPGGRADLRLAIRAGSVNETGANTGVAHFVEHMLFNGTEQFPENELIDVLRGFGASFGADVNAYTSYDETVYSLDVPNDDESFDTALSVLEQWLSHATFDPAQVEAERGVILDEWRQSTQTADGRLFDVAQELYLAGSAYDGRDPIGTDASIQGVPQEELRQFYDDWYRPDNAAVIVVGDIDAGDVVDAIEELFGPATPRSDDDAGPPRHVVPDRDRAGVRAPRRPRPDERRRRGRPADPGHRRHRHRAAPCLRARPDHLHDAHPTARPGRVGRCRPVRRHHHRHQQHRRLARRTGAVRVHRRPSASTPPCSRCSTSTSAPTGSASPPTRSRRRSRRSRRGSTRATTVATRSPTPSSPTSTSTTSSPGAPYPDDRRVLRASARR